MESTTTSSNPGAPVSGARTDPLPNPLLDEALPCDPGPSAAALCIRQLTYRAGATTILDQVDLVVPNRELVAVAGGSGAGKTTLVEVVAGLRRPSAGTVRAGDTEDGAPPRVGFVPQDDIIHPHLPLRRTLLHAARLRLPAHERGRASAVVDETLARLGLAERADVLVGALSGGQRKRASIAVELLTHPEVLVLDEPTSGLDPQRAAEVMDALRDLVERGITVMLTTHHASDIERCDRVVFMAPGGRLAYEGSPADALERFGVTELAAVYPLLGASAGPERRAASLATDAVAVASASPRPSQTRYARTIAASPLRQGLVLTVRSGEVMARNRLTLAILLGSPALVISMMAILFPAGSFASEDPSAVGPPQVAFWMAFSAFFFGLTYGLLQIVTERSVLRRERHAGLNVGAYLASKVAVLTPILVAVVAVLIAVLGLVDRLPGPSEVSYPELFVTLVLTAISGLLLGLVASAAVADATQATLALPMICFPQVLFAGAVVPVVQMTSVGSAISVAMTTRWSFESLGRILVPSTAPGSGSGGVGGVGGPYASAFTGSPAAGWAALGVLCVVAGVAAIVVLHRRTAVGAR